MWEVMTMYEIMFHLTILYVYHFLFWYSLNAFTRYDVIIGFVCL